ncbi:MAG TPA: hypothetical protein VN428_03330 [Bryobacteraceae bacterium]|nr:hypothetical protein [Bryobacteraceae bacterium]
MKALKLVAAAVACFTPAVLAGAEYYAAPTGNSSNDGSITRPWDLYTALSRPQPGDTVWLRGGTYNGTFDCLASGTTSLPIKYRQYPGERARVDGGTSIYPAITAKCSNVWFQGFEIFFSDTRRVSQQTDSFPTDIYRGNNAASVQDAGIPLNIKFINLVVHDSFSSFGVWADALNAEVYGNIIYHDGWDAPDRGHGHGIYSQNANNGTKHIEENIMFRAFSHGLHVYGWGDLLNNYHIEGNVAFDNGALSLTSGYATNFRVNGDGAIPRNVTFKNNFAYYSPSKQGGNSVIGNDNGCAGMVVTGNHFLSQNGTALIKPAGCTDITMTGNTFFGGLSGFSSGQYPQNTYYASRPSGTQTFVRPNRYEPGRAHVIVLNWAGASAVSVDVSGVLGIGDTFEVRDVQDYFGAPVLQGTWNGGLVALPTSLTSVSAPIGNVPIRPTHTSSEFNVYVLQRTASGGGTAAQNKAPVVSAGSNQTITLPSSASLNGTVTDDGLPAGAQVTASWTKVSGPGTVTFANAASSSTTAAFSTSGSYVLRLTASDSQLSSSGDVTITVNPAQSNQAPVVTVTPNISVTLPSAAALYGTVTDDGLPAGSSVSATWSKVSGPGTVTFANASSRSTTATFSVAGSYLVRLTATDGQLSSSKDVTVIVLASTINQAPVVSAGPPRTVVYRNTATLTGTVTDDGLPSGSTCTVQWRKLSGPGSVKFGSARSLTTTVRFGAPGVYILRLSASDTQLSSISDVVISVVTSSASIANAYAASSSAALASPMAIGSLNGVAYISTGVAESGTATFTVNAPASGTYVIWGKVSSPSSSADSFYVSVNAGAEDVYDVAEGLWSSAWQWSKVNGRAGGTPNTIPQREFSLSAGTNRIVFRGREANTLLNQILVTNDLTFVPTN